MAVSLDEYRERLARTRAWMKERGVDLLILNQPEHYNWISGYDPTSVFYYQALILDQDEGREPILLCNKAELALCEETCWLDDVRVVWTHEDQVRRTMKVVEELGYAESAITLGLNLSSYHLRPVFAFGLKDAMPKAEIIDVSADLDDLRLPKSDAEVDYLRRAAHVADLGVTAGINAIRAGVTDREVMAQIQHAVALNGGEFPAYPTLVDARGTLHGTPTGKILEPGDVIYLEVSGVVRRYHCNISRTVVVGEPSQRVLELYEIVKRALDEGTDALRAGNRVSEIVDLVGNFHDGYEQHTWGRFGFSMEIAYPPIWIGGLSLMRGDDHELQPGMVLTMEPGLSYAEGVTMMLGNNVLVTEHEPEILNNVPADLFVK
jgi:Xaa-Pro dipeptidase